jgi:hypothetical protein
VQITAENLQIVISKIADAVKGCDEDTIIAACIASAFSLQNPFMTYEQLEEAIHDTSAFIAHLCSSHIKDSYRPTPKEKLH